MSVLSALDVFHIEGFCMGCEEEGRIEKVWTREEFVQSI